MGTLAKDGFSHCLHLYQMYPNTLQTLQQMMRQMNIQVK